MTIRQQIAALTSPVARELLGGLADEIEQMIVVPDSWLPEKFQGSKAGGRTLSQLREMDSHNEEFDHDAERARRVELYRKQFEESKTPDFFVIEYQPFMHETGKKKKKSLF